MIHAQGDVVYVWKQGLRERSAVRRIELVECWRATGKAEGSPWMTPHQMRKVASVYR